MHTEGPTIARPGSMDRAGTSMPSAKLSVRETSICVRFRKGPRIATCSIRPLGPTSVTRSSAAQFPGWRSGFFTVS